MKNILILAHKNINLHFGLSKMVAVQLVLVILNFGLSKIATVQLVLVITCLGGRFAINCPSAFLKILKLPE